MANDLRVVCSVTRKVEYSWSDLPQELLDLIMEHVRNLSDLLRCHRVCHSWRSAAALKLCGNNHVVPPLLLLCTSEIIVVSKDYGWIGYCWNVFFDHGIPYMIPFGPTYWASSYHGWLLLQLKAAAATTTTTVPPVPPKPTRITLSQFCAPHDPNETTLLQLFNPYSRTLVKLTPPPPLLCVNGRLRFIASCRASDPSCIIYVSNLLLGVSAFYGLQHRKWSPPLLNNRIVEAIFYKGHFYRVDQHGVLRRLLIEMDCYSYEEEVVSADNIIAGDTSHRYLVESSSSSSSSSRGGELMMVVRTFELEAKKTKLIEIFKLNWSNGKWEEVSSLGDQALFLARFDSKFVSIGIDNHEYKPNTIYFVDEDLFETGYVEDFGVYDLENHKIQPLKIPPDYMDLPFCGWFQPTV